MGPEGPPGPPGSLTPLSEPLDSTSLMSFFSTSTQLGMFYHVPTDNYNNPDSSYRPHQKQNPLETATKFLEDLKRLSQGLILRAKPDGSRMYPARSCRDIADYYPEKPNGLISYVFVSLILCLFIFKGFILLIRMKAQRMMLYLFIVNSLSD